MRWTLETDLPLEQKKRDPVVKADLTGKVAIVIGANIGLGYETAKHFVLMGAKKVILACRDSAKGQAAVDSLIKATGRNTAELGLIDLGDFASVSAFAEKATSELDRLDILVANAGIAPFSYGASKHGFENMLQVNNLSTNLVCLLLLPKMIETAKKFGTAPRMVVLSSSMHYVSPPVEPEFLASPEGVFAALSDEKYCNDGALKDRYSLTKLFNIFFVRELHNRLPTSAPTVTINAVNPGFCYSGLRRDASGDRLEHFHELEKKFNAFTSEEGARHVVWPAVALSERENEMRGAYTSVSEIWEPSDYALAPEGAKAQAVIWDDSVRILKNAIPKVEGIVKTYLVN